jgi:hypothetical protein
LLAAELAVSAYSVGGLLLIAPLPRTPQQPRRARISKDIKFKLKPPSIGITKKIWWCILYGVFWGAFQLEALRRYSARCIREMSDDFPIMNIYQPCGSLQFDRTRRTRHVRLRHQASEAGFWRISLFDVKAIILPCEGQPERKIFAKKKRKI